MKKINVDATIVSSCNSSRLAEQVETISKHQHVKSIVGIDDRVYQIEYCPWSIKSPYRNNIYHLEMVLPVGYPDEPPVLKFIDRVYHLNVGYHSGEIRMAILECDWSPFIALNSVMESLDQIMEVPD
jgi:ubiquitin-protein ligase